MKPTMPFSAHFAETIAETFLVGQSHYGDINLLPDLFIGYVWGIACKHLKDCSDEFVVVDFARKL